MSWKAVDGIVRRAVARGQFRLGRKMATHSCIDEVAIKKVYVYMTIIWETCGHVIAIEEERKKERLKRFYDCLSMIKKRYQSYINEYVSRLSICYFGRDP